MAGHRKFNTLRHKADADPDAREVRERARAALQDRDDRTLATLAELRARCGVRQVELAERLDRSQAQVSRMENARDPLLSTLAAYVDALGGQLELTVKLAGVEHPLILDLPVASEALMPAGDETATPAIAQGFASGQPQEPGKVFEHTGGEITVRGNEHGLTVFDYTEPDPGQTWHSRLEDDLRARKVIGPDEELVVLDLSWLTTQERAVIEQMGLGATLEAVAQDLGVTRQTVSRHARAAFEKIKLSRDARVVREGHTLYGVRALDRPAKT